LCKASERTHNRYQESKTHRSYALHQRLTFFFAKKKKVSKKEKNLAPTILLVLYFLFHSIGHPLHQTTAQGIVSYETLKICIRKNFLCIVSGDLPLAKKKKVSKNEKNLAPTQCWCFFYCRKRYFIKLVLTSQNTGGRMR
jgi:hypothetical protein